MSMSSQKMQLLLITFVLAAGVVIIGILYTERLHSEAWAALDVEQIGKILCLYVEDHGHLPKSEDELHALGYLEIRDDGATYPGPTAIARRHPEARFGVPYSLAFNRLRCIEIRYGCHEYGQIVRGLPGSEHMARLYSDRIVYLLECTSSNDDTGKGGGFVGHHT